MSIRLPHRSISARVARTLSLAAVAALLALPATAQGRKPGCAAPHAKHATHACTGKARHGKARGKHASKPRRAKRGGATTGVKVGAPLTGISAPTAGSCQGGSNATTAGHSSPACLDSSEPACEEASSPASPDGGKHPACAAASEQGPEASEEACEDAADSTCVEDSEEPSGASDVTRATTSAVLSGRAARARG